MRSSLKKLRVLLDTKPLIKLFAQEEGWREVKSILSCIEADQLEAGISVVTLTEIYYKYLQEQRPDLAKTRIEQLRYALYLEKIEISQDIAVKAGEFKGKYHVSIADAFIAASAYSQNAIVISDDPDFKKIPEVNVLTEIELYQKLCAELEHENG
ncbi:PIN domain-containing protein [Candidatus Bathyarchaeota archaeon]|nr:PIN domain-containing protein [Candidatus Bathyarchaeota archaeon]MBS7617980.1 PIN domain-containing protein [Candidatus Bathyarchaeota archaeon]